MKAKGPLSIGEIVAATGFSRATIDPVINQRLGVHPRTQAYVLRVIDSLERGSPVNGQEVIEPRETLRFEIVIQAGEAFTHCFSAPEIGIAFR